MINKSVIVTNVYCQKKKKILFWRNDFYKKKNLDKLELIKWYILVLQHLKQVFVTTVIISPIKECIETAFKPGFGESTAVKSLGLLYPEVLAVRVVIFCCCENISGLRSYCHSSEDCIKFMANCEYFYSGLRILLWSTEFHTICGVLFQLEEDLL